MHVPPHYRALPAAGPPAAAWLHAFKERSVFWCAQVLGGGTVFPPRTKPRAEDAEELRRRMPAAQRRDAGPGLLSRRC